MILRRGIKVILPVIIALFMLVFIANLDPGLRISNINNQTVSNFSLYLALKNALNYFQHLFRLETTTAGGASIARTIISASLKSLLLMLSALLVSVVIGIARGLNEGYRSKNKNLNSLGTLVVFSIPDVLIVISGLLLYILIAKNIKIPGGCICFNEIYSSLYHSFDFTDNLYFQNYIYNSSGRNKT